ncbi:hypothetical protein Tco_0603491 [Tanacetum coccineum]
MEVGTTTNNLTARLPIINPGGYDLWLMRIEQYFLMTDYSLWEVIKNGNKVLRRTVGTVEQEYEPTTAKEKQDRRNEMKPKCNSVDARPNKDQLNWRIQGEVINQEDMNLKLLSSLPSEWKTHALICRNKRNKVEIKTISLDDLCNSNSTNNTNSTNKADNTAHGVSTTHNQGSGRNGSLMRDGHADNKSKKVYQENMEEARHKCYQAEEEQPTNHALMAFTSSGSSSSSDSESLNDSLESQVIDKFKTGLGYDAATAASSAVESFVNLNDKSGSDKGYHSVPPPLTGNFIPHKPDLTFIDEIVKSENLDVTTVVTPCNAKTVKNKGISNTVESNAVRINNTGAPIIEDWNSDDEREIDYTARPSTKKIKYVKTVRETDATKQHKHHSRGNQRNWNNLMS